MRDPLISGMPVGMRLSGELPSPTMIGTMRRMDDRRSARYVFVTSAVFGLVILGFAGWISVRRDY